MPVLGCCAKSHPYLLLVQLDAAHRPAGSRGARARAGRRGQVPAGRAVAAVRTRWVGVPRQPRRLEHGRQWQRRLR